MPSNNMYSHASILGLLDGVSDKMVKIMLSRNQISQLMGLPTEHTCLPTEHTPPTKRAYPPYQESIPQLPREHTSLPREHTSSPLVVQDHSSPSTSRPKDSSPLSIGDLKKSSNLQGINSFETVKVINRTKAPLLKVPFYYPDIRVYFITIDTYGIEVAYFLGLLDSWNFLNSGKLWRPGVEIKFPFGPRKVKNILNYMVAAGLIAFASADDNPKIARLEGMPQGGYYRIEPEDEVERLKKNTEFGTFMMMPAPRKIPNGRFRQAAILGRINSAKDGMNTITNMGIAASLKFSLRHTVKLIHDLEWHGHIILSGHYRSVAYDTKKYKQRKTKKEVK